MALVVAFAYGHEVFPEAANVGYLLLGERTAEVGINLFEVVNVGKQLPGIGHILVYIVEVVEKRFAQRDKFVETLFLRIEFGVVPVEGEQQIDVVGRLQRRKLGKEVGNRSNGRREERTVDNLGEIFFEKDTGPSIGKYKGYLLNLFAVGGIECFGDLL